MDSSPIFLQSNSDLESLTRISLSTVSLLITLLFLSAISQQWWRQSWGEDVCGWMVLMCGLGGGGTMSCGIIFKFIFSF